MRRATQHIILLVLLAFGLGSCNITKRVPENEYLLRQVKVEHGAHKLDKYELEEVLKHRPNKRILGNRLYLRLYNRSKPEKVARKKEKKAARLERKNAKRAARNDPPKELKRTTAEWWRDDVGESPVILDTTLVALSKEQLRQYLYKEGYFNAVVRDTITYPKKQQADVIFSIDEGEPFFFGNISYSITEPNLSAALESEERESPVVSGERFDMDILQKEQLDLVDFFRQRGFYYFSKEYITMLVDTNGRKGVGDVVITLRDEMGDTLKSSPATSRYKINRIYVNSIPALSSPVDTVALGSNFFVRSDQPIVNENALLRNIMLRPGDLYRKKRADRTYSRLSSLGTFQRVDIAFDTTGTPGPGLLNTEVRLIPAKRQRLSAEGFGTHQGGFLGTSLSLGYQHKNLFNGMEQLDLSMNFGFEAQQTIIGEPTGGEDSEVAQDVLFNTLEIGPELKLTFPSFLIPFVDQEKFSRSNSPRSTLSVLYSFQRRPDFTRILTKGSFGYEWNESRFKRWGVYPIEINEINIPSLSADFRQYLDEANDPVLTNSYTDHFIIGARINYTYNGQDPELKRKHLWFWRTELETSGNLLRALFNTLGTNSDVDTTSGNSFYSLGGVRFAQYVKLNSDLRYYLRFHERSQLVVRTAAGAGLPLSNLDVLPFETSFFGGGANGLRAWRARSIGPGSFNEPLTTFDRIGEISIEGNVEYRFGLFGFIEGALFTDVGNVWFFEESQNRRGSGFSSAFLDDLAVGTGVGARLNFDYFIVRFDLGLQTKDPALPKGERWLWQPKEQYEQFVTDLTGRSFEYRPVVNFNLGIGYPF